MIFSLEVLPAGKGDCLLLHYGSSDRPRLMLIDGGPAGVYQNALKDRLTQLWTSRRDTLDDGAGLPIDVVLVSHIDDDHIHGIIELAEEQQDNNPDLRVSVTSLWHNSFDDLLNTNQVPSGPSAPILAGIDGTEFSALQPQSPDEAELLHLLASVPQGRNLRKLSKALDWSPNDISGGDLIMAAAGAEPVEVDGLMVTVIGPMREELLALQKQHDKWIKEQIRLGRPITAEAVLAAYSDTSVPNLSSIVLLVEFNGGSMLLTGDASGDKILEGLEMASRLGKPGEQASGLPEVLEVDILKMQHHGSDRNVDSDFFQRITARHYVFSGDGKHGNPERATLQMLLGARGTDDDYAIHLTYEIADIDAERAAEWLRKQPRNVGAEWPAEDLSLAALFDAHPDFKAKVQIVQPGQPHLLDLLEPVEN
ncbi:hypothetical protein [Rhodopseudomonas palustris]|uniref:Metallo-beta-lactamase domain-containing protein n=1 Tax=Rhodopseudomonas palustris TaxID=1076 RepID=A0A418VDZ4_RHOPL|nr:hypothetical protein [Rhodopseudomonas palustris]RJF74321.1 hypothetical protein D4Q52_12535 [Rhodopseudomonas palustris]